MSADSLTDIVILARLGVVTVLLWVASRIVEFWRERRNQRDQQENFIRAVFSEVDFNTLDMTNFLETAIPIEQLRGLFDTNGSLIPHITNARHTDMYSSRLGEVHNAAPILGPSTDLIPKMIFFYAELEKLAKQVDGLSSKSFSTISAFGKTNVIDHIYTTAKKSEKLGLSIIEEMIFSYPQLNLKRHGPNLNDNDLTLSQKLRSLEEKIYRMKKDREVRAL